MSLNDDPRSRVTTKARFHNDGRHRYAHLPTPLFQAVRIRMTTQSDPMVETYHDSMRT
jgi:hypothetical protein